MKEWSMILLVSMLSLHLANAQKCTPWLECKSAVVVTCGELEAYLADSGNDPVITNNCPVPLKSAPWQRIVTDCDSIYSMNYIRMWSAASGGPILCMDTIHVLRTDLSIEDALSCPTGTWTFECGDTLRDALSKPELRAPTYKFPGQEAYPLLPGQEAICGVSVSFTDEEWALCGNTKTVYRTWRLKACATEVTCIDTIVVVDTKSPEFSFDSTKLDLVIHSFGGVTKSYLTDTISTSGLECLGNGIAPYATVFDSCQGSDVSVSVKGITSFNTYDYNGGQVIVMPFWNVEGPIELVEYTASDGCGNTTVDTVVLVVRDQTKATAACHDAINISLTNVEDFTFMKAGSLDSESEDNCGIYKILARRTDWLTACDYDTTASSAINAYYDHYQEWVMNDGDLCSASYQRGFTPEVPFCCEDVGKAIMVELMVIDYNCNVDICWGFVNVEDKLPPVVLETLPDVSITCDAYAAFYSQMFADRDTPAIQSSFGSYALDKLTQDSFAVRNIPCSFLDSIENNRYQSGLLSDNCGGQRTERYTIPEDNCQDQFIRREFVAKVSTEDGVKDFVYATQRIFIEKCPLDVASIILPNKDTTVYDCRVEFGLDGKVNIPTIGPSVPESLRACRQIGIGYYDKVFEILGDDLCKKVVRTWCVVDWCDVSGTDWESISKEPESYVFRQYIKIVDTVAPVIAVVSMNTNIETVACTGTLEAEIEATDACGGVPAVSWKLIDQSTSLIAQGQGEIAQPGNELVPGSYTLLWTATDDCGNTAELASDFTISSNRLPSMAAITSLTTSLNPMDTDGDLQIDAGMVQVWAAQFNTSCAAACGSGDGTLEFFVAKGHADATSTLPETASLTLSCEDYIAEPTVIPVQFWAKDIGNGTSDYLNVFIVLSDHNNACNGFAAPQSIGTITGLISTESAEQVANVEVKVNNGRSQVVVKTGDQGLYEVGLSTENITRLTPEKDVDHSNGVSTLDLIKVQKHILGIKEITSPYKLIAADANRDKKINPLDIVQMRKVLMRSLDRFPNNTSWRFVDATYKFRNPSKALQEEFPEYIEMSDATSRASRKDFVGVKIGDLDGNVFASRSAGRGNSAIGIHIMDRNFKQGEQLKVPVYLDKEAFTAEGIQIKWKADVTKLKWLGMQGGLIDIDDEAVYIDQEESSIILSAVHPTGIKVDTEEPLFYILMEAIGEGDLSERITVDGRSILPQIYDASGLTLEMEVAFVKEPAKVSSPFLLMQNYPNPFRAETTIQFSMVDAGNATLKVYDPAGRIIKRISQYFEAGSHSISLHSGELVPGVLYYELQSSKGTETKRMILLE